MSKVTSFIPDSMKETTETVNSQAVLHKSLRDPNLDLLDKAQFDKDVNTKDKRQPRNIYAAILEEKTIYMNEPRKEQSVYPGEHRNVV